VHHAVDVHAILTHGLFCTCFSTKVDEFSWHPDSQRINCPTIGGQNHGSVFGVVCMEHNIEAALGALQQNDQATAAYFAESLQQHELDHIFKAFMGANNAGGT
jgi:hypothetical protein